MVRGDQFAGRTRELAAIRGLVRARHHAYLFAPRRYGKTSLLKEALEPPAETGAIVLLWCDCLPTTGPESLAARIGETVVRGARRSRLTEWAKQAASLFRRLRPTLTAGPDGQISVGLDLAPDGARLTPGIEDAFEAVGRLAKLKSRPAVLVLDEFPQITAWDSDHQVEATARTVIQHQRGTAYVFAGSQRHLLQQMFGDRARPLFQLAVPFPVGRLRRDELEPWLATRFRTTGIETTPEGIDLLMTMTAGHPWATQYLAHFVWDEAVSSHHAITEELVRSALSRTLEVGGTIYASEFVTLTPSQRSVLTAVAREPVTEPTGADYLRRHRLPSKSTVNQALKSLVEKGHVEQEKRTYLAGDPLFAEWVRRQ